jgi:hypothetical protein
MDFGFRQDILTNGSAVLVIARMNKKERGYENERLCIAFYTNI